MKQIFVFICLVVWSLPSLADSQSDAVNQVSAKYDRLAKEVRASDDAFNNMEYTKAFQLYKKTALKSLPFQEYSLAEMYFNGMWVKQNLPEAKRLFAHAKERGFTSETPTREKIRIIREMESRAIRKARASADLKKQREQSKPSYIQKTAIFRIRNARATIVDAQRAIDRQKEIEKKTGVVNKYILYQAGSALVSSQDMINASYAAYQQSGGKLALKDIR